jgi:GntR family transcriptional regulator
VNIQRDVPIPLYYQVEQTLREQIESGRLTVGDLLPSEAELMSRFGVSRITIQKALNDLARAGLLDRKRGKGTFVKPPIQQAAYSCLSSFTAEVLSSGRRPGTRLLDFKIVPASQHAAEMLELADGAPVLLIKRLRTIDEEPVSIDSSYLPHRLVPKISRKAFTRSGPKQSLYYVLENECGLHLSEGEEKIRATIIHNEASLLKIKKGSPAILRICVVRDPEGTPIAYQETITVREQSAPLRRVTTNLVSPALLAAQRASAVMSRYKLRAKMSSS